MQLYTIYLATNVVNGKQYVGFDSAWPRRKQSHLAAVYSKSPKQYKQYFHDAIRKYGKRSFSWEVIYQSLDEEHTLTIMEEFFITQYRTYVGYADCNGYNLTLGGEGLKGNLMSKETRYKKSLALKGKPSSQSRRVVTPNGVFEGVRMAADELGLHHRTVTYRINSPTQLDWYWESSPKHNCYNTPTKKGTSRGCNTPHGVFTSIKDCNIATKIPLSTIVDRCTSPFFTEWSFTGLRTKTGTRRISTPSGEFVSIREASQVLGITVSTISARIRSVHKAEWCYA